MSRLTLVPIVLVALLASACSRPAPPDPGPAPQPPEPVEREPEPPEPSPPEPTPPEPTPQSPPSPPVKKEKRCDQEKELACISSDRCTLVPAEDDSREYLCRDSVGPCETGFRQRGGGAEACEAKPGCRFVPGRCYCAPDVTCICGGGPPAQCVEA